jgi:GNAT superfamily N-acetyltransferase
MKIQKRPYDRARDYERINDLLWRTYEAPAYPNWLQARWEYMHWHPGLQAEYLHKIAVWEDDGEIVAVVNYEDAPSIAYFQRARGYDQLLPEMAGHAIEHLAGERDGKAVARIWVNEFDQALTDVVRGLGFSQHPTARECISIMAIPDPFPAIPLKEGFRLAGLDEENDLTKLDRCLYRGFNHPGEPEPGGEADRALMQSTPLYNKHLNVVAITPNGDYASFSGIWFDPYNLVAYVEPVATDPDYRRMGLGKACVLECVRRTGELGAKIAYVESEQDFYHAIGFETITYRPLWQKFLD